MPERRPYQLEAQLTYSFPEPTIVHDYRQLGHIYAELRDDEPAGLDFETQGTTIRWRGKNRPNAMTHRLVGFGIFTRGQSWYVSVRHLGEKVPLMMARAFLERLFEWGLKTGNLWCWNLGFELQICRNEEIDYGDFSNRFNDSSVTGWLAGWGSQLKLKPTAEAQFPYLAPLPDFRATFGDTDLTTLTAEQVAPYAAKDPALTVWLAEASLKIVRERQLEQHYREIDMPMVELTRDMHELGALVDRPALERLREAKRAEAEALALQFEAATSCRVTVPVRLPKPVLDDAGLPVLIKSGPRKGEVKTKLADDTIEVERGATVSNDGQVSRWLYDELKLWPVKGLKRNGVGNWPVDRETVERYGKLGGRAAELADLLLRFRRADKLCSTYLDVMIEQPEQWHDGRLHPSYHLTGTDTQRFSSSGPNFQNIPAHSDEAAILMAALIVEPGWKYVKFDYSQLELRIMTHAAQDPGFLQAFQFGDDPHADTLAAIQQAFPAAKRVDAKITNFSTIYRISAPSLAVKIRAGEDVAERFIDGFYQAHPAVRAYHAKIIRFLAKHGYAPTIDGFRRYLDARISPRTGEPRWGECNKAISTSIQGSAGGIIKIAQRNLHRRWVASGDWRERVRFASQIHDALGCVAREDFADQCAADMRAEMTGAVQLRVPLEVDGGIGTSWADAG